jgi:hypothetical protein
MIGSCRMISGFEDSRAAASPARRAARVVLVHLVDEEKARQPDLVQLLQYQLQRGAFFSSASQTTMAASQPMQRRARILREFDGARAIDEGVAVAHECGGGGIEFHAHAVGAGFRRRIAGG